MAQPAGHSCSQGQQLLGTHSCPSVPRAAAQSTLSATALGGTQRMALSPRLSWANKNTQTLCPGLELPPLHTALSLRGAQGTQAGDRGVLTISLCGAHSNIFCYQHPPTPQGFFLRLPTQFSSTICQCYLLQH